MNSITIKMLKLKLREKGHSQELKKIRLGFYPYAYVRTVVMRSLLFKKDDYGKMLKMSFGEIAKLLQDSSYKNEIDALAAEYSGSDLLELALNRSLAASFKKLMKISSYDIGLVVKEYAMRKDLEDIKAIIRGRFTNANEKEIERSLTAAGSLSREFLTLLLKKESIEEILKCNGIVDFSLLKGGLKELNEKNSLAAIENAMDKHYYGHLIKFSGILPKQGRLFREFLLQEAEVLNILTLLRLKRAKLDNAVIKEFIISSGDKARDSKITGLAAIDDFEKLLKELEKTEYKNAVSKGIEEFRNRGSLITLEIGLLRHLLGRTLLFTHQNPLSVDTILGYMFAKDMEVRNLRIIVKGKQLGLSEEFIEGQMVY